MQDNQRIEEFLERAKAFGCVPGLSNIRRLMQELGDPQEKLSVIHIAGTNGKGSTGAMLSTVLHKAGYRVGHYSSPAVFFPEEIYQVNGIPIEKDGLAEVLTVVAQACERMRQQGFSHPTLFEIETAAAFLWFYKSRCQIVILETGLGGSMDATNVVRSPLCSVFTSISMDHMAFLGDTLTQIAGEKAGIIKEGCPAVTASQLPEVFEVLESRCRSMHAFLYHAGKRNIENIRYENGYLLFDWGGWRNLSLSLLGAYQPQNAVCALLTLECLTEMGYEVSKSCIWEGLKETRWPGRFEVVSREPLLILDGAHNGDAAKKLRKTLEMGFTNREIIYIIGVLADKDHEGMLKVMLPLASRVYTVTPKNPRALPGEELCREAGKYHGDVTDMPDIPTAVQKAVSDACGKKDAMVLAFGSLSWLGSAKEAMQEWTVSNGRKEEAAAPKGR